MSTTIRVRGQATVVFFFGDMPLSDEQLRKLPGYVGRGWCDIYASDIAEALQAAAEALGDYEVDESDVQTAEVRA